MVTCVAGAHQGHVPNETSSGCAQPVPHDDENVDDDVCLLKIDALYALAQLCAIP